MFFIIILFLIFYINFVHNNHSHYLTFFGDFLMKQHTSFRYAILPLFLLSAMSAFADENTATPEVSQNQSATPNETAVQETANNAPATELAEVVVQAKQGTKVRTNLVTLRGKDESVETDLRGLFKNEPSIQMGGGNGTSQYLYIRGMGHNSVDVKVDNAYSDGQFHYHQGRHMLDPAMVKIVSVQKGAGSASAGIGQTNGAVIAKTLDAKDLLKNSSNPNIGGKVNLGYNSNDGYNYGASAFGQTDMFDFVLAGSRVDEDNYEGGKGYANGFDGGKYAPYSALDKTSYLAKFGLNANENHRFVLSHRHEQTKGERLVREEFLLNTQRLSMARQSPALRKMTVDNTNLEWTGKNLGFAESAEANIYRMQQGRWSADDSGNGYAGGKLNDGATRHKLNTTGANVNFDSRFNDNLLLKYGLNFRNQEAKPNRIFLAGLQNQEKQDTGVYGELISDIGPVTLTTGLRYDHFNFEAMDGKKVSDGAINPSVGVIYQVNDNLSFSASHNYATRSPRFQDLIMSHGNRGVVSIADNTKAEQARNTEIGFNFDNGMFGFDGSYFWQNIKDALGTSTARNNHLCTGTNTQCYSEIINAGRIKNRGYELGASFRWKGLTTRLGVAENKPRFYGELLSSNPEYASAIGRAWTASVAYRFEKPNLEVALHHRQLEEVKAEDNFFLVNSKVQPATEGKPSYGVTDVSLNWKPLNNDKMNVNFAINNIGNRNYIPHAQRSDMPGAGREYRVGFNYTF